MILSMCIRLDTGFTVVCYYMPLLKICCVNTITLFMKCNYQQLSSNSVSGYSDCLGAVDRVVSKSRTVMLKIIHYNSLNNTTLQ